jgi:hypothetical protein
MKIRDSKGDAVRITYGTKIQVHDNNFSNNQHCCVMLTYVDNGSIKNNIEGNCCCSGDRLDSCKNVTIENETISPYTGSGTYDKNSYGLTYDDNAIQICQRSSAVADAIQDIIIKNCNIKGGVNAIDLDGLSDGCNVNITNNKIHESGYESEGVTRNGGIGITHCGNGITIQNNDIIGSYFAGINVDSVASGSTRIITVRNNNITNGKTGYAVKNTVPLSVNISLNHNYISGYSSVFSPSMVDSNPASSPNITYDDSTVVVVPPVVVPPTIDNAKIDIVIASLLQAVQALKELKT